MKKIKRIFAALLPVFILTSLCFPVTANAASKALGDEVPYLFCLFTDENGDTVDGNALSPGDYTVNVVLSDMGTASVFQFTADYDTEVLTLDVESTYASDGNSGIALGGVKNENGTLVAALVSENDSYSELDTQGTVFTTLNVTVSGNEAIDFADYFHFNTDPDLTFVEADYGHGIEDAYVLDTSVQTAYNKYQMNADESPILLNDAYDVSGRVVIAVDVYGRESTGGVVNNTVTLQGTAFTATTDENGYYTIENVPAGTYTMTVSGPTTIQRNVTLIVSPEKAQDGVIETSDVPVAICDYTGEGVIDVDDATYFVSYLNNSQQDKAVYADLTAEGVVDADDVAYFINFLNDAVDYDELTLN